LNYNYRLECKHVWSGVFLTTQHTNYRLHLSKVMHR